MISRSGRLFLKLLMVIQEVDDDAYNSRTRPELERKFGNVEMYAGKSGKLSSNLISNWYYI